MLSDALILSLKVKALVISAMIEVGIISFMINAPLSKGKGYRDVAKQGKETALNNASKYRNEQIPSAEARADAIIQDAEAQKTARVNEATAQVARFNAMYEEYMKNPDVTKQRMFFEAMEKVLPDLKVIIESPNGDVQTFYPIESFTDITVAGDKTQE